MVFTYDLLQFSIVDVMDGKDGFENDWLENQMASSEVKYTSVVK